MRTVCGEKYRCVCVYRGLVSTINIKTASVREKRFLLPEYGERRVQAAFDVGCNPIGRLKIIFLFCSA